MKMILSQAGIVFLLAVFLFTPLVSAQPKESRGGVVLQPESAMDQELSDDLTEVLISAVIEKSSRSLRVLGKELVRTQLSQSNTADKTCQEDPDCLRRLKTEMGLSVLVVGKVGKARTGYRLDILWIGSMPETDRTYRHLVEGDLGVLIEGMATVAEWVMKPEDSVLRLSVDVEGVRVELDGAVMSDLEPLAVAPGEHVLVVSKAEHKSKTVTITCVSGQNCPVKVSLEKKTAEVVAPIGPVEPPPEGGTRRSSLMPWVYVLGGVALASTGGAIYFYLDMNSKADAIEDKKTQLCPGNVCSVSEPYFRSLVDPIQEEGETAALWTNVLGGVAIASAVAAGTLTLVEVFRKKPAEPTALRWSPVVAPDFTGFSLELSF